ncbi:uncharacterized protein LOC105846729 [Hydra vulgaris]|uniref:uncharacterized protein LOC105846729 n=1 Tax=Hydra vulgaris TaxID=6087 RepID=UPI001F5FA28D|nr:uncharacterized protein LOC105846729 [Hydra vulgaris]
MSNIKGTEIVPEDLNSFYSTTFNSFSSNVKSNVVGVNLASSSTILDFEESITTNTSNDIVQLKKKKNRNGGFTCCVPKCFSNSVKHKNLSFYAFSSKDKNLRKIKLYKISRRDFKPTLTQRVCSKHFEGGKKTCMNKIPTILPKTVKLYVEKVRDTYNSKGLRKVLPKILTKIIMFREEDKLRKEVASLQVKTIELEKIIKIKNQDHCIEISSLQKVISDISFRIDQFKHNTAHFKFYTGFESYELFKVVFEYLQPTASSLIYYGLNATTDKETESEVKKKGRKRTLTPEEEFFMVLIYLKYAFSIEDLGVRFKLLTNHACRLLIT